MSDSERPQTFLDAALGLASDESKKPSERMAAFIKAALLDPGNDAEVDEPLGEHRRLVRAARVIHEDPGRAIDATRIIQPGSSYYDLAASALGQVSRTGLVIARSFISYALETELGGFTEVLRAEIALDMVHASLRDLATSIGDSSGSAASRAILRDAAQPARLACELFLPERYSTSTRA